MSRRNSILRALALLRERVFPSDCASCGDLLLDGEEAWDGLCAGCRPLFEPEEGARCRSCGKLLVSEREVCIPCRNGNGFAFDRAFSLYPYAGRFLGLLRAWKFGRNLSLGNFFARGLIRASEVFALGADSPWVPVPPRPGKIRRTGRDQIRQLARCLALEGKTLRDCLRRLPSLSQKKLDREGRRNNLAGRIVCSGPPPERLVLFDDVITTGYTLDACARTLRENGAREIYAITLFYS